jgi:hypothetical protein
MNTKLSRFSYSQLFLAPHRSMEICLEVKPSISALGRSWRLARIDAIAALLIVISTGIGALGRTVPPLPSSDSTPAPLVIPFELVNRHILIRTRIGESDPLWFIFDTGDRLAIIDLERANSLGLKLQGEVNVGGAGAGTLKGSYVRDATVRVLGAEQNPQPVVLAIPLSGLEPKFGHNIDGIIGTDFIRQFVLEVDYPARVLRLYDKDKFVYSGTGEIVPIKLNAAGHPIISAEISMAGRPPIRGSFVIDVGSGGSLILNKPFVEKEKLLDSTQKTIKSIGGGGAGGKVTGRIGRIAELRIGSLQIDNPVALFSEDTGGAFASSALQGNIGAHILSKFRIFLDYNHDRIIFEPNATFKDVIVPASSGVRLLAEGSDYRTFRVDELLEQSPATEAGLKTNDLILSVDGRPAADWTLSQLNEAFERPIPHAILINRGDKTMKVTLTPRRLI